PDVLFLDEPTNNLDPQSRLFLLDRIRDLNAQGLTILLTTHDMDEADQLCERIAIMDHGKVLVNDTPAELKKLIPGGNALELRVRVPEKVPAGASEDGSSGATSASDRLLDALRALPGVTQVDEVNTAAPAPTPGANGGGRGGPWGGGNGGNGGGAWGGAPTAPEPERGVLTYRLYAEDANTLVGATAQTVLAAGAEVRDLHVKRPSLEDVFIFLTGRQLR
ncbi:MAG: hypothetical protein ACRDHP_03855, partial [Ktedonobacterales bacterium]